MSLRELEDSCKVNIRFMYLMDHEHPTYRTFGYFIIEVLPVLLKKSFMISIKRSCAEEHVDLNLIYIDAQSLKQMQTSIPGYGRKQQKSQDTDFYEKITALLDEINSTLAFSGLKMQTNTEYIPEELKAMVSRYADFFELDCINICLRKGHRKSVQQRQYETLLHTHPNWKSM